MEKIEAKKQEGNDLYRARKYDEAIGKYTEAIDMLKSSNSTQLGEILPTLLANRAAAKLSLKRYDGVVEDAKACLDIDPDNIKAIIRLASALEGLNKLDDALDIVGKGMTLAKKLQKKSNASKKNSGVADFKKIQNRLRNKMNANSDKTRKKELTKEDAEQVQRLQTSLQDTLIRANRVSKEKGYKEDEVKRCDLTLAQLKDVPEATNTYLGAGRLFLRKPKKDIENFLKKSKETNMKDVETLTKLKDLLDKKVRTAESSIREVVKA
eukprot:snap_masked-scaffold_5-processed-gene-13.48-mRNA-1 protein AED:0.32 eAED:0.32 QI:0/-1/0/1/-1/1/1/0/266